MSIEFVSVRPTSFVVDDLLAKDGLIGDRGWVRESTDSSAGSVGYRVRDRPRRSDWPEDVTVTVEPSRIVVSFYSGSKMEMNGFLTALATVISTTTGVVPDFVDV
jgi:hypothetical protein